MKKRTPPRVEAASPETIWQENLSTLLLPHTTESGKR
jgi:hypothetical protein